MNKSNVTKKHKSIRKVYKINQVNQQLDLPSNHPGLPDPVRRALRVAVPALQRPLVEPPARLLQGRLQDDVRHGPGALQEGRTKVG